MVDENGAYDMSSSYGPCEMYDPGPTTCRTAKKGRAGKFPTVSQGLSQHLAARAMQSPTPRPIIATAHEGFVSKVNCGVCVVATSFRIA